VLNLVRRELERGWVFLVAVASVLAGFEMVLCAVVGSVDTATAFEQISQFAPPALRTMMEQNMAGGSPAALLAFGWNHPVAHALLSAVAITLAARAIAGEIENGAIELVMAQPVSRTGYFAAHLLFGIGALAAMLLAGLAGTVLGQRIWGLEAFGFSRLAALFANALLLQLAIYGITLLFSSFGREAGRVALAGVLVAVISFLVNVVAALWSRAAFAKPWSLHSWFEPRDILVRGDVAASSLLVLAAVAGVGIAAAFARFVRRDLP
jgi:ABC-type transport system involved in multi-copper enzyme maturation permease subunit